ncbi:MAG TPA: DsbC family protein [Deferrimonas sp.]|jgi:thiol:disulfide interchange protein DsbC
MKILLMMTLALFLAVPGQAFTQDGCGAGTCADCHSLTKAEATDLLKGGVDKVLDVAFAEIPGLWMVSVEKDNQKFPLFIDFSKAYLVAGNVIRLKDHQNITTARQAELNKVDVSKIPLDDALLLGKKGAKTKVIVFTDPECPYCKKLHVTLKEVVQRNPEIAFLIKLFPLKMHPNAYGIAKSIVCSKSLEFLELSFAGLPVPPATCETDVVDQTLALVETLGIRSTPTLVLPDGLIVPGAKSADDLLKLLGGEASVAKAVK